MTEWEPVYPFYDLKQIGRYEFHFFTMVRKLWTDGKYYVIPVRDIYYITKGIGSKRRAETLRSIIDMFHVTCFRVLTFWDCDVKTCLDCKDGVIIKAILDVNQQTEAERLVGTEAMNYAK